MRKLLAFSVLALASGASAQDYRNTDSGHPIRLEDAIPLERYGLEFQFPSFRIEQLTQNVQRTQIEPRLSFGLLPRTELELRAPIVYRQGASVAASGLAGLGVSLLRNFNDETPTLPAFAVGFDGVIPAGAATTSPATFALRALATKSVSLGRLHMNAAYGTYNLIQYPAPNWSPDCVAGCGGVSYIPLNDGPCEVVPVDVGPRAMPSFLTSRAEIARQTAPASGDQTSPITLATGRRLLVGVSADHSFPISSTMIAADLFVERFSLSTSPADWSAEIGARQQLGPQFMVDASFGRRFTGASQSWYVTLGTSFTVSASGLAQHGNCA